MSKYSSMCKTIDLMLAVGNMMTSNGYEAGKMATIIEDLRAVARDVRYGGVWDGDFESTAAALCSCKNVDCAVCPYKGMRDKGTCRAILKQDAAAAIRQMGKDARETREENRALKLELEKAQIRLQRAEMYMPEENIKQAREMAQWQIDELERGKPPLQLFPWEEDGKINEATEGAF